MIIRLLVIYTERKSESRTSRIHIAMVKSKEAFTDNALFVNKIKRVQRDDDTQRTFSRNLS